jgi:hypothetical protein
MFFKFKNILSLFYKSANNSNKESDIEKNIANKNNCIIIYIDNKTQEPIIKTHIYDLSDKACRSYAEMLFNLNAGLYQQSIFDLLSGLGKQDEDVGAFITNVILNWMYISKDAELSYQEKEWNNNKPLVSPINFGKHAK